MSPFGPLPPWRWRPLWTPPNDKFYKSILEPEFLCCLLYAVFSECLTMRVCGTSGEWIFIIQIDKYLGNYENIPLLHRTHLRLPLTVIITISPVFDWAGGKLNLCRKSLKLTPTKALFLISALYTEWAENL